MIAPNPELIYRGKTGFRGVAGIHLRQKTAFSCKVPPKMARPGEFLAIIMQGPPKNEVRPFCWTDLTIRFIVMGPVLHRTHSIQLFLDSILVVVTKIFIKFFQEVLDRVELLQI